MSTHAARDDTRSSVRVPSSRSLSVASARGGMRSPRPKRPRNRLSGDLLATRRARFGATEPNICLRAAVYGTEGHRFESCRARYSNPCAVGVFRLAANVAGWQQRGQRGNSEQVAPRADGCAGRLPAWVEVRGGLSRRAVVSASSTPARWPRLGPSRSSATARRGHCAAARRCTGSASRGLIATPAAGTTLARVHARDLRAPDRRRPRTSARPPQGAAAGQP